MLGYFFGSSLQVLDYFSILKPDNMFDPLIQSADVADQEYLLEALRKLHVEEIQDPLHLGFIWAS